MQVQYRADTARYFLNLPFPAKVHPFDNSNNPILWSSELPMSSFISKHMASLQLPNYLRSNRKRLGLSQREVAYLLGSESGAKACRYERFTCEPGLETALACEVIFQRPARELFGGLYQEVQRKVAARAKALVERTDHPKTGRRIAYKHQILTNIAKNTLN